MGSQIRLVRSAWDNRIRLAKKSWDTRIRLAKKWDNRIRLAKKYMDWDKRIRLAKKSSPWDTRIRLAKKGRESLVSWSFGHTERKISLQILTIMMTKKLWRNVANTFVYCKLNSHVVVKFLFSLLVVMAPTKMKFANAIHQVFSLAVRWNAPHTKTCDFKSMSFLTTTTNKQRGTNKQKYNSFTYSEFKGVTTKVPKSSVNNKNKLKRNKKAYTRKNWGQKSKTKVLNIHTTLPRSLAQLRSLRRRFNSVWKASFLSERRSKSWGRTGCFENGSRDVFQKSIQLP